MKKNYFKKTLSLVMTVLMLMSCWVFVAPTEAEAATLEAASAIYNKSLLNGINTSIDTTMPTTMGKFKDPNMEGDENASYHVSQYGSQHYKNIFYSPTVTSSTPAAKMTGISNVDSVMVYYPETVMLYDGSTKPQMGIVACLDGGNYRVRSESVYLSTGADGLVITDAWKGETTANLAHIINMHNGSYKFNSVLSGESGYNSSYVINTGKDGEWYFYASDLRFDGTLNATEWVRTITPTWGFYGTYYRKKTFSSETGTMAKYTDLADVNIYVMNIKGYRDLLTTINTDKTNITNNAGQYTPESVKTYVNAANAILNLNPKNVGQSGSAVATWGSNMSTAYTNYVNAKNGLKNREYEVTYENMFSLADWKYSQSSEKDYVTVDLSAGTVTVQNPNASGEWTTPQSGSSANANTRNTSYYAMPVVGGQEYTFKYTVSGTNTQMFAFFYDKNGGCTHSEAYGAYNFSYVSNTTAEKTFKAPDGSVYMEIRFDNDAPGTTAVFSNIMIYPAVRATEVGLNDWTTRPYRKLYSYNAAIGTLETAARTGYKFDKWMEDTDGDGVGDTAPSGNVTKSRVLYSSWTVDNFTLTFDAAGGNASATSVVYSPEGSVQMPTVTRDGYAFDGWKVTTAGGNWNAGDTYEEGQILTGKTGNATLTAQWKNMWTVTYYDGDKTTVLATAQVKDGETIGTLPKVTPTKDSDATNSYEFDYWYNATADKKLTEDTVVNSDITVYTEFKSVPHTNFTYILQTASTCTENAKVTKKCADCDYNFGNVTYNPAEDANAASHTAWLAKGHDYTGGILAGSSTGNTDADTHSIKCARYSKCGSVEKVAHSWTEKGTSGATCTTPGTVHWECPCGAEKDTTGTTSPDTHNFDETKGTSNSDGKTHTVACTYNDDHTKSVACTDNDNNCICDICGQELIHVYDQKSKTFVKSAADCYNDAVYYYTCKCGKQGTETWTDTGSKLKHNWTETEKFLKSAANCTDDEVYYKECSRCNVSSEGIADDETWTKANTKWNHKFDGDYVANNNGTHDRKCTNTGCTATGATDDCTYGEWTKDNEATHSHTCTLCGYTPAAENHDWTAWSTVAGATNDSPATQTRSCTVCGRVETKNCVYTSTHKDATCTAPEITTYTCTDCEHGYTVIGEPATGHDYTGAVKSYNGGFHNYLCANGCGTYGFDKTENAKTACTYAYTNNSAGKHQATCTECNYTFEEDCSGGQATCTAPADCEKCHTAYGATAPHSFTGTPVQLEGDKHAYLCVFCSTEGLYGVGDVQDATEDCSGGTATCIALAECSVCKDTYGDYAAHVFDGDAVKLDGDVHAYRCSVCKDDELYGVGSTVNKTEACSGGTATCTDLAVCDKCGDTHGELNAEAHKWGKWTNVEGQEKHERVCEYNADHTETEDCYSPDILVIAPDCETPGYTLNTCVICNHEWQTAPTEALGHDWTTWVNNEDGTHTRTCKDETCKYGENGGAKVETKPCTKENADAVVTAPTCLEGGYTTYTCKDCGYVWTDDATPATGHSYTENTKKTDAKYLRTNKDCVTDWTYWYCCDNCDVSAETEKDEYENEADLYWVREAAVGHKYDAKKATEDYLATAATCTAKAIYYYSCSVCGASSEGTAEEKTFENGLALGHEWTDTETFKKSEADCVNNEVYYKECSRCHISSENETGATWIKENTLSGHDFDHDNDGTIGNEGDAGYTAGVAATCEDTGMVEHYTCQTCGKHFKADKTTEIAADKLVISALRHDYKDIPAKAATCEEDGYTKHKQCQREGCGYRNNDYKVVPAKGHDFKAENGYYTDVANGYHAYKCSNCDAVGVDKVKYSAEYDGLDWVITGGIQCDFTGEYVNYEDENGIHSHKLICVCGNEQSAACVDAEPVHILPTCTEDGYYVYTCDVCSFEWTVASDAEEDKALDHDLEVVANNNGTHSEKCQRENCGYVKEAEKCSTETPATKCGDYDICDICNTAFGEAKPHVFTNYVSDNNATCTADGTKTAVCDTCEGENKATDTVTDKGSKLEHTMVNDVFSVEGWKFKPDTLDAATIKEPSCHEEGRSISYCATCSYYKTKAVKADPSLHIWETDENGELVWETIGGNCATGVTKVNKCSVIGCNKTQIKTEAVPHEWKIVYIQEAGCVTHGYIDFVCSACGFTGRLEGGETEFDGVDYSDKNIVAEGAHDYDKVEGVTNDFAAFNGEVVYVDVDGNVVHVEKYPEYNADGRGKMYCNKCTHIEEVTLKAMGIKYDEEGNVIHKHPELATIDANGNLVYKSTLKTVAKVEATCTVGGHKAYEECMRCSFSEYMADHDAFYIAPNGHKDDDNNGKCDACKTTLREDESRDCGCICHKESGFMKFIYKILRFFWKLFKINPVCDCGYKHY